MIFYGFKNGIKPFAMETGNMVAEPIFKLIFFNFKDRSETCSDEMEYVAHDGECHFYHDQKDDCPFQAGGVLVVELGA